MRMGLQIRRTNRHHLYHFRWHPYDVRPVRCHHFPRPSCTRPRVCSTSDQNCPATPVRSTRQVLGPAGKYQIGGSARSSVSFLALASIALADICRSYDCNGSSAQNWEISDGPTLVKLAGTNYCLDSGDSEHSIHRTHKLANLSLSGR